MTDKDQFIADLYPSAVKVSRDTGVSKELILAQAAQETGWGQHVLAGTHNIFNIKSSADWDGPTKAFKVWEIENGQKVWKDQDFRVYRSTEEALRDRVKFLEGNPRYAKAGFFDEGTKGNFVKEAAALQKAGYATDPLYAKHLIAVYNGPTMQHAIKQAQGRQDSGMLEHGSHGAAVHTLQVDLAKLDYTDAHGRLIKPDGGFGTDTHHAVEAFQRDHYLKVDGKVGHDTQTALQAAMQARTSTSLDNPRHADHSIYRQSLACLHDAESQRGIAPGLHSERVAAALVPAAKSEGITHIDRVLLSERGDRAFVEQKGSLPGINDKIAFVDLDKAIHTTIAQSTAVLAQVNQQQRCLASLEAPIQAATVEPAISGPVR